MGRNGRIRRAPGFNDRAGDDFELIEASTRIARETLYARGYQPIETPLIEQTELFLRRSGGLLSSQLFDFMAPDGSNISLRPEVTAPVVRHALERTDSTLPLRFQYASPIFRYAERAYDAPSSPIPNNRQFIQIGAELIGASQAHADGEIIAAAYNLAQRLGVRDVSIRIGHVGLIREILGRFNLSDRARLFLANNVSELAKGGDDVSSVEAEAKRLGLIPTDGQNTIATQASASELLSRLASGSVRLPEASDVTSRTAADIVAGLQRKVEWDTRNVDFPNALALMSEIAQISNGEIRSEGIPKPKNDPERCGTTARRHFDTIHKARELTDQFGLNSLNSLDDLMALVESAELSGVDSVDISVDLGLSASIAYYSGMIFEVRAVEDGKHVVLGGGGRYDGLASALGSEQPLPALGFALNLDTILDLIGSANVSAQKRRYIVLSPMSDEAVDEVVERAEKLRSEGHSVVSLFDCSVDAEAVAKSIGNAEVVKVGSASEIEADAE